MTAAEPESESASRKEIFEYLRNVQKETEIRSRLSGINIWVLYGAMGFIIWSLLDPNTPGPSRNLFDKAVFLCQLIVMAMFFFCCSKL